MIGKFQPISFFHFSRGKTAPLFALIVRPSTNTESEIDKANSSATPGKAEAIFFEAISRDSEAERNAYLDEACQGNWDKM